MPSEPLSRCLRLLEAYERKEAPPWRPRQPYAPAPAPLTLAELHRCWRALLAEGPPAPAPGLTAVLAAPRGLVTPPAEGPLSEAEILAILREAPRD